MNNNDNSEILMVKLEHLLKEMPYEETVLRYPNKCQSVKTPKDKLIWYNKYENLNFNVVVALEKIDKGLVVTPTNVSNNQKKGIKRKCSKKKLINSSINNETVDNAITQKSQTTKIFFQRNIPSHATRNEKRSVPSVECLLIKCKKCGQVVQNVAEDIKLHCMRHVKKFDIANKQLFTCLMCHKTSSTRSGISNHIKIAHKINTSSQPGVHYRDNSKGNDGCLMEIIKQCFSSGSSNFGKNDNNTDINVSQQCGAISVIQQNMRKHIKCKRCNKLVINKCQPRKLHCMEHLATNCNVFGYFCRLCKKHCATFRRIRSHILLEHKVQPTYRVNYTSVAYTCLAGAEYQLALQKMDAECFRHSITVSYSTCGTNVSTYIKNKFPNKRRISRQNSEMQNDETNETVESSLGSQCQFSDVRTTTKDDIHFEHPSVANLSTGSHYLDNELSQHATEDTGKSSILLLSADPLSNLRTIPQDHSNHRRFRLYRFHVHDVARKVTKKCKPVVRLVCNKCNESVTATFDAKLQHCRTHFEVEPNLFIYCCSYCPRKYVTLCGIKSHVKLTHHVKPVYGSNYENENGPDDYNAEFKKMFTDCFLRALTVPLPQHAVAVRNTLNNSVGSGNNLPGEVT